jgi:hypothetical protein
VSLVPLPEHPNMVKAIADARDITSTFFFFVMNILLYLCPAPPRRRYQTILLY